MTPRTWMRVSVFGAMVFAWPALRPASAEPRWIPVVVARGELRQQIESTPIELRPNRPLHFYGNTVRRLYYRGNPIPQPQDFSNTGRMLIQSSRR